MRKRSTFATIAMACGLVGFSAAGCSYNDLFVEAPEGDTEQIASPLPNAGEATPAQVIALSQPATETMEWLDVKSPSFGHAQAIPERFTAYGKSELPTLKWTNVPRGTQSFAVIVEDPDAPVVRPFVHLILYNIPGDEAGISTQDLDYVQASFASGMTSGRNSSGSLGYVAPQPPIGEAAHTYHFQVFALDTALSLPPGAEKQAVLDAMKGHVLAKGETIGTFQHR